MTEPLEAQIQQLRTTIATLEAQRALLGDTVADGALALLRSQLAALQAQLQPSPAEERRLLSILFTDIVGSTSLAEKLDPDWRKSFMENVEPNRELVEMWERMSNAKCTAATAEGHGQQN